jgi:hypothetical protein
VETTDTRNLAQLTRRADGIPSDCTSTTTSNAKSAL